MASERELEKVSNPNNGGGVPQQKEKPKVLVIMGPTGSGKSRLAIDLASYFSIEIINADSMQVYLGLDVLTNKVPFHEQQGVPHHLLGTISPNVEFTSKDFRDAAIPLIDDILSRDHLPVIVGGTNFYIQALVSPFLLDDSIEKVDHCCLGDLQETNQPIHERDTGNGGDDYGYEQLKALDPIAANRIHPNDHRKITQYIDLFIRSGIQPSKLFQGRMAENWGRLDSSRYNCCFICVDASVNVLDRYVEQRVDRMIEAGLLDEVYDIYTFDANYTRGLRQAIGVGEFEDFLRAYLFEGGRDVNDHSMKQNSREILNSSLDAPLQCLLEEAIDKLKTSTRRLVRRQRRRVSRLQTLFGWKIHHVDSTESLLASDNSDDTWNEQVVKPSAEIIRSFVSDGATTVSDSDDGDNTTRLKLDERDLWTQYVCKECGNRVLRGSHEWEQHKQGRGHRKRVASLRKRQGFSLAGLP